jgi:tetratricopeptide (TPR) repeat protein
MKLIFWEIAIVFLFISFVHSQDIKIDSKPTVADTKISEPAWVRNDEICSVLDNQNEKSLKVSEEDNKTAKKSFKKGYSFFKKYKKSKSTKILFECQPHFEKALKLDLKNSAYQKAINAIYRLLSKYQKDKKNWKEAIILEERLVRLNTENCKDFGLYYSLGSNYLSYNELDYALLNSIKAEKLLESEILKISSTRKSKKHSKFNNHMYNILLFQNKVYRHMSDPQKALQTAEKAGKFATSDKKRRTVENLVSYYKHWNFWGDKEALDLQIEIRKQTEDKQYNKVRELFNKLINKYPDFFNNCRLKASLLFSSFEFQHTAKKPEAIERLLPYIMAPKDSVKHIENFQEIYNAFSSMSYIYGVEQIEKDRYTSYCYLLQVYSLPSEYKEKIGLEILKLTINNIENSVDLGSELWNKRSSLSASEKKRLCEYLIYANKRNGDTEAARHFFNEYKKL